MSFFKFLNKNLLYLSICALFLVGSLSLTFVEQNTVTKTIQKNYKFKLSKLPILKDVESYPYLSAQGVYAIDLDSSVVLYEKNPDVKLYPASTTKMLTAIVAMDNYDLDQVLNTGRFSTVGQKMGLVWNENIKVEDLLYGLLIHSGNDAAEVLAMNHLNGREAFISEMNLMAKELHATNSHFENPSGLDSNNHYSTARDLVRIAQYAMKNPLFAKVVSTEEKDVRSATGNFAYHLTNRNELLGRVDGVLGVKTGWTEAARENLVTYVDRDGKRIMLAVLGSQDRFGETEQLVEWIYNNYEWKDATELNLLKTAQGR